VIDPSHVDKYVEIRPPVHISLLVDGMAPPQEESVPSGDTTPSVLSSRILMVLDGFLGLIRPYYEGGGPLLFFFSVFGALTLSCTAVIFCYFNIPFFLAKIREFLDSHRDLRQTWVRGSYRELTLVGHTDDIECHVCHGNILASAGLDKTVRLWDLTTGENLAVLSHHKKAVWQVQCFDDLLASGSCDGMICVWQISQTRLLFEAGKQVQGVGDDSPGDANTDTHTDGITCLKFDPEGSFLYSGSSDKTIKIWDLGSGTCVETLLGHKGPVTSLALNSEVFVSGSEDGTLRVYSKKTRTCRLTLYGHLVGITTLLLDTLRDPASPLPPNDSPQTKIISGSQDGVIRIWDLGTGTCNCVLNGHTGAVFSLCLDYSAQSLVSSALDETVRVWNLASFFRSASSSPGQVAVHKGAGSPKLTIHSQGSTGVAILDGILFCGGVGSITLHSPKTLAEARRIAFDDVEQEDFDPAVIIGRIFAHDTGVVFDCGDRLKVFHFSGVAVKRKHA